MNDDKASKGSVDQVTERPAWLIPVALLAMIAMLCGAILLYYFAPAPDLLMSAQQDAQRTERVFEPQIGDNRFRIAERYVRAIVEDASGKVESIDLHVAWPIQLTDLAEIDLSRPRLLDPEEALYLTLAPARPEFDSAARLKTLYPIYFAGPAVDAGHGLVRLAMKPGSGYDDQEIFVGGEVGSQFIARCFREDDKDVVATCTRDQLTESGLSVRYRFNRELLPDWQRLEADVNTFLEHLQAS